MFSSESKNSMPLKGSLPAQLIPWHDPAHNSIFHYLNDNIENIMRPHYWYLVVVDCSLDQPDRDAVADPQPLVYYSVEFLNEGTLRKGDKGPVWSHIPQDEEGLRHALVSCLVFLLAF